MNEIWSLTNTELHNLYEIHSEACCSVTCTSWCPYPTQEHVMHSHTYLSTVPAVVPAPEEVEGLQTAMAFLSVHIRHPAGRLCTRQQKTTGTLEYLPMCCICRYVLYIQVTPLLLGNSVTNDALVFFRGRKTGASRSNHWEDFHPPSSWY